MPCRPLPTPPPPVSPLPPDITGVPVPSRFDVEQARDERARLLNPRAFKTYYPQQADQQQQDVTVLPGDFPPALNYSIWLDYDTIGRYIPASFIGISREYTNESVFWDRNLDAWGAILDVLGPSPVIRIGGASQEALTAPPTAEYLRSLVTLHCTLGVRFILGLPLFQNAPQLALTIKQAYDKAFENFPRAIVSYELGNEVRRCGAAAGPASRQTGKRNGRPCPWCAGSRAGAGCARLPTAAALPSIPCLADGGTPPPPPQTQPPAA